jgi:hypothetical protein
MFNIHPMALSARKSKIFEQSMPKPVKRGAGSQSLWDEKMFNEWEMNFFRNSDA